MSIHGSTKGIAALRVAGLLQAQDSLVAKFVDLPKGTMLKRKDAMAKVVGKGRTWVTRPGEFELPVVSHLGVRFAITHHNADGWSIVNE